MTTTTTQDKINQVTAEIQKLQVELVELQNQLQTELEAEETVKALEAAKTLTNDRDTEIARAYAEAREHFKQSEAEEFETTEYKHRDGSLVIIYNKKVIFSEFEHCSVGKKPDLRALRACDFDKVKEAKPVYFKPLFRA